MEANNVKAMREALVKLRAEIERFYTNEWIPYDAWQGCDEMIDNALSAPSRNCDIYGDYDSICKAWEKSVRTGGLTFGEWTFAQAMEKEGGAE